MDLMKRFVARFGAAIALYIRYTYEQPNNLIRLLIGTQEWPRILSGDSPTPKRPNPEYYAVHGPGAGSLQRVLEGLDDRPEGLRCRKGSGAIRLTSENCRWRKPGKQQPRSLRRTATW